MDSTAVMLYCLQMVFSTVRGSGRYVGSAVVGEKVGYPVGGVEGEVVGISDIDGAADGLGLAAIMVDKKRTDRE